jgi:hypothetical protein
MATTRRSFLCALSLLPGAHAAEGVRVFNVRDYGATGNKADNATNAIQKAVDACAKAGGGMVYLPSGAYTSGTIYLRSHIRFHIEAGATLYASSDAAAFAKAGLLYGEDIENISIEGRGALHGQAEYVWRKNMQHYNAIEINRILAEKRGNPMMRPYPKGWPDRESYPHLILLLRCKDIRIAGLSFINSPSWTINPYACERLTIDGVYIRTSLKAGVWADGIDPDGCKDVHIANCTIETGDDAIVFYSSKIWGPPLPCENITITNCRLSSASSALKFCDGNANAIRNVTVDNTVITGSNRGIAFMVMEGGIVEDVVLSNLTVNCERFDWFWWGDGDPIYFTIQRRGEVLGKVNPGEPPAGTIRNVIVRNVIAHGKGSSLVTGHPDSWLDNVSLENVRLFVSSDPAAPFEKAVHAMRFQYAHNLKVKDVEVFWDKPYASQWQSALYFEDVSGLRLEGFSGAPAADTDYPVLILDNVEDAGISNSRARPGTGVFLKVKGAKSHDIHLIGNDLHHAKIAYESTPEVKPEVLKATGNY